MDAVIRSEVSTPGVYLYFYFFRLLLTYCTEVFCIGLVLGTGTFFFRSDRPAHILYIISGAKIHHTHTLQEFFRPHAKG